MDEDVVDVSLAVRPVRVEILTQEFREQSISVSTVRSSIYTYGIRSDYLCHVAVWSLTYVQVIEDTVRERYNDPAALVIRTILKTTEAKQLKLSDVRSGA